MNILIVGLGSIALKHIEALRLLYSNVCIYALRSKLNSSEIQGVINIYSLENSNIKFDFAIISNPTVMHYEYINSLSSQSIPLFIEKPALHTLHNVHELLANVERSKIPTYVACNLRFHPCISYLKDKLSQRSEQINELNVYCGSYLPDWRPNRNFREIYSAQASLGGGVHLDLFHELDYVVWILGLPIKNNVILRSSSTLNIDAIDYANYILQYKNYTASIILNYYRRKAKREIEIIFDNEIWTVDLLKCTIKNAAGEVVFQVSNFNLIDTYVSQLKYFISCLQEGVKPMNSLTESVEILKICLCYE